MTLPSADDRVLRRYLLGTVTDAARQDLENRLFSDDRILWERLSIAEDELISDYVQRALGDDERRDFEHYFLCTTERRAKLEFARALHAHAAREQVQGESPLAGRRRALWAPAWALAAAALLLLVVQLPRLGLSGPGADGGDVVEVPLSAGRTRAVGGELPRVRLGADSRIVRLRLDPEGRFASYLASVHRVDDDARLAELTLTPAADAGGAAVTLAVPAEWLADGDYYVRLQGIPPGAAAADPRGSPALVPLHRYDFRVLRD